jgi:hypothetical protein
MYLDFGFLRCVAYLRTQGFALASVAATLGYKRVAILANTDAYGAGVGGELALLRLPVTSVSRHMLSFRCHLIRVTRS